LLNQMALYILLGYGNCAFVISLLDDPR